jgi:hypothetical protein
MISLITSSTTEPLPVSYLKILYLRNKNNSFIVKSCFINKFIIVLFPSYGTAVFILSVHMHCSATRRFFYLYIHKHNSHIYRNVWSFLFNFSINFVGLESN